MIRDLLRRQARSLPDAQSLPLRRAAVGWDCEMWRLGDQWAVRMPRRGAVISGIRHEHLVLPPLAERLHTIGVGVPAPLVAGEPDAGFPWPWSVVPWFPGVAGTAVPRPLRGGWAERLADALAVIHCPAPADLPPNPLRGVPLADRATSIAARLESLDRSPGITDDVVSVLSRRWSEGLAAPVWTGAPVMIHGDLHPANLVAEAATLTALVDFIDVAPGDPAYDLAVAWLAFDDVGRRRFIEGTRGRYDPATWTRARGWAAAFAAILLEQADEPAYRTLAAETVVELRD